MIPPDLMVDAVTILNPTDGTTDDLGNEVPSEPDEVETRGFLQPAPVAQASKAGELIDGQQATLADWALYLQPGTVITAASRVRRERDGALFDVVAPPAELTAPGEGVHHLEVRLQRVD